MLLGNGLWCFGQIGLWKENGQIFCIALVKPKGKLVLLFCHSFSCRHCEGTRTCLQLLLDKEDILLWQEVSLACLPCLLYVSSLTPTIVRKVVSNGVHLFSSVLPVGLLCYRRCKNVMYKNP